LLVLERNDITGIKQRFFIVDMHHHIGREEKVKNLNPAGPDGSYIFLKSVFWGNQWKPGLIKELEDNPDDYGFKPPADKRITEPHPAISEIMDLPFEPFGLDIPQMFKNTFLSDTIVAFPMGDTYRDKEVAVYSDIDKETPQYAYSNDKMIDVTSRFPNSLRFIPFGRVVPTEENAFDEMERAVNELNVKGFKLHPKTDGYPINDESVVDTLAKSARLDVPCLFHTSFLPEVKDLADAVNKVIVKLVNDCGFKGDEIYRDMDLVQRQKFWDMARTVNSLRVIVGHCGWHTSVELFQILMHPCIYGEVSGIKGDVVRKFFKVARQTQGYEYDNQAVLEPLENEGISPENLEMMFPSPNNQPNYNGWSSKIMFGTDFPFLDQNQAIDVFRALLSKDFPGNDVDIANFLGLNALGILFPEMNRLGVSQIPEMEPVPEPVRTPHKDLLVNFLKGAESRNLKKSEVNVTFNPLYARYPFFTMRKDFLLRVKAADLDRSYHVQPA
jgi:predicted TIM-barrel fold metal-dependent hydrolase